MGMIEAMARAILPGIDEAADFVKECAFITAQAAARAAEPFIQGRIDEAVKAEREACAREAAAIAYNSDYCPEQPDRYYLAEEIEQGVRQAIPTSIEAGDYRKGEA